MPHTRREDQSVDAFSLPKDLLAKAKAKAIELKMTKSGFYRYCLAKFLGYSEDEARRYAEHRAVLNSVESAMALRDAPPGKKELRQVVPVSYKKRHQKLKEP